MGESESEDERLMNIEQERNIGSEQRRNSEIEGEGRDRERGGRDR